MSANTSHDIPADKIGNTLGLHTVLLSRFGVLGDVVMTIPVIYSACRSYPDVTFVLLTADTFASLFVDKPANLLVETRDLSGEYHSAASRYRLAGELMHRHHYDAYIDLQNDLSTLMLRLHAMLHHVKTVRFNHANTHSRQLTRRTNKVMLPMTSARARYRAAFFAAGIPADAEFEGLYGQGRKADPAIFAPYAPPKAPGEKWIGVAPFAAYDTKEYPLDKMEEVIAAFGSAPGYRVFILGGEGREAEEAGKWQLRYPRVTSLAGKGLGFDTELALLSHIDVMVTMDSANMHLAAIAGTPTISIWGATHYYCGFRGWHQRDDDMVQLPVSCRPCSITGDRPCFRHDRLCLTALRPETIIHKIKEKLGIRSEE